MRAHSRAGLPLGTLDRRILMGAAAALSATFFANSPARGQVGANINRNIRPLVTVSFQNPQPAGDPLAVGIFDTGNDNITISPETNSWIGIGAAYTQPVVNPEFSNDAVVGNATNITVSGWLGGAFGAPEVNSTAAAPLNGPAHIFSTDSLRARTQGVARANFAPSLTYFVNQGPPSSAFSMVNIGTAFAGASGGEGALVAGVDPINGAYMPIPLAAATRAGVTPAIGSGNQATSSVSFFDPNSIQTPTSVLNANPGFLITIAMTPGDGSANFNRQTIAGPGAGNPGTTRGHDPVVNLAAGNPLGVGAGTYIADTGAPNTGAPNGGLLGTNILNGYGQYWDFSKQQILLFGPSNAADQQLLGPGMLMTVDRNAVGLSRTGVNQMNQFGPQPVLIGGGTATIPAATPAQQSSSFFRTHMTHSNAAYITGTDALGLNGGNADQLDGASMGADGIAQHSTLWFSVDANSTGIVGAVPQQAALGQQMGDVFESQTGQPMPALGFNSLRFNQDVMGLGGNVGPTVSAVGRGNADNLRDFDLQTNAGFVGAGPASVMRNTDPSINAPGDNRNPGNAVAGNSGLRGDIYGTNFDTYFSLDAASPGLGGASPADVLVNNAGGPGKHVFAVFNTEGLVPQDDIDAIALQRVGSPLQGALNPGMLRTSSVTMLNGTFDANPQGVFDTIDPFAIPGALADLMLFSLAPGSPSLGIFDNFLGRFLSPADVFITDFDGTFAMYATAESLGLNPATDNIDGLDSAPVPEPVGGLVLAALAAIGMRRRRRSQN